MAAQQLAPALPPQLSSVLGSLSVSLEAELNRYRRNRRLDGLADVDLFADLEDSAFDLDAVGNAVEASIAEVVSTARPIAPPPVPRNKKILPPSSEQQKPEQPNPEQQIRGQQPRPALPAAAALALSEHSQTQAGQNAPTTLGDRTTAKAASSIPDSLNHLNTSHLDAHTPETQSLQTRELTNQSANDIVPTGYLASSERLIESLAEGPSMPDADSVEPIGKPKRKTISLLAGATLGFFALVAGLGASYLMANPMITQRIASGLKAKDAETTVKPTKSFDPPGPDLSANEFVDLELDNLSSLKMPQTTIDIGNAATAPTPSSGNNSPQTSTLASGLSTPAPPALPPIESPAGSPAAPVPTQTPIETQAVIVPVGLTYYVTLPFTTEQGLATIRQTVSEAFVRQFADGNRIQMAAFDNPQAAQAFIAELADKDIAAQIYGPTTE
ncbi:MAG: hypothetical protein AAFO84_12100 [Cyanobacteria bacterium J06598_1]